MKIPRAAIEKALEGGWKSYLGKHDFAPANFEYWETHWEQTALDADFWSSLGKALGWDEGYHWGEINQEAEANGVKPFKGKIVGETTSGISYRIVPEGKKSPVSIKKEYVALIPYRDWFRAAMRFYDLILTNQPIDDFWRELLSHPTNV